MRSSISALVLNGASVASFFLLHLVAARDLGPGGYGIFSYAFALANVLAAVVVVGWPTALKRFVAQYADQRNWALLRGVLLHAFRTVAFLSLSVAAATWLVSLLPGFRVDLANAFKFAAVLLPFAAFVRLRSSAFFGLYHIAKGIALDQIALPLGAAALLFELRLNVRGAVVAYVSVSAVTFFAGTLWLARVVPIPAKRARSSLDLPLWRRVALAMVSVNIAQIVMGRADVLMLGAMLGPTQTGLFAGAKRFANLGLFPLAAVSTVAVPMLAAAYHSGRHVEFRRILKTSTLWSLIGASGICLPMSISPGFFLRLLGPRYLTGSALLRILATAQLLGAATGPVGNALLMSGREKTLARIALCAAAIDISALFVGIRLYGVAGAAAATAVAVVLQNGWALFEVRKMVRPENG